MAYMNQEHKKKLAPGIKAVLKKYNMIGTIAVDNHSTLVVNLREGPIDFGSDYIQVNTYHADRFYKGKARDFLVELIKAMQVGNWDKSDAQADYFNVGWYVDVNVGQWNKPYKLLEAA